MMYLQNLLLFIGHDAVFEGPATDDDFVIYPDCVMGNPLNAKKAIRWMLFFWRGERIPKEQCVIVYHPLYFDQVAENYDGVLPLENVVTIPTIEPGLFYPEEKTIEAVLYTGKQTVTARPAIDGMVEISKASHSRQDAAALLRKARNLYSMDHHTIMLEEALLCGCRPWLVHQDGSVAAVERDLTGKVMDPERDAALARKFVAIVEAFFK